MAHLRACGLSLLCVLVCALGLTAPAQAQDADRIWGQVHTKSGDVHEGFIRWDGNEASWVDILGGSKEIPGENYAAWLEAKDADGPPVRTIDLLGFRITWDEADPEFPATSQSGIRFGHLSSLRVIEQEHVELTLRSGELVELEGGAVRRTTRELTVDVPRRGEVEVDRDELDRVVFSAVPPGARASARRLHGTVDDRDGNRYTGYISWNRIRILASDVLRGEDVEGGDDRRIRFDEIASIEQIRRGARIVLINGVERELRGTSDVGRRHRGVRISDPALGVVEVEWDEFESLRFHQPDAVADYDTFDGGRLLVGTVITQSGEEIEGVIRWDADEAASWEMLNGRAGDVTFTIELANVSRIERGEVFGAVVTLLDGRTFELEESNGFAWRDRRDQRDRRDWNDWDDSNDVDLDNKGILIQPEGATGDNGAPSTRWRVIAWDEFREVRFRHDSTGSSGGLE